MNEGLENIHQLCIRRNLQFASYRLPGQEECTTLIQEGDELVHCTSVKNIPHEKGFIMAPFDTRNGHSYMMIRPDLVIRGSKPDTGLLEKLEAMPGNPEPVWKESLPVVTGKEKYMEQVRAIKSSIATGSFQKAVLSRISVLDGAYQELVPGMFRIISEQHPNAFVYLFRSGCQFWMGASPEPLLRLKDKKISTVSLAGTRPYAEEHMDIDRWTVKEVLEQEYVTRYIHDALHSFGIRDYRVNSTYVKKAGNLLHLRTDFSLDLERIGGRLWDLVEALHPTPAVAGQPKEAAISFIKGLEPHDRAYYTGFLGPVDNAREIDLFVNLRCMKITPGYLALYVGGGITLDSDPADEWEETRLKADSLLKIIAEFTNNPDATDEAHATYR